ncbi:MAG TPA: DNA polymerase IV [Longimicrobiales bacterium]|nr:DNA polymerase IV [Longimicrobiales bacterium]
MAQILPRLERSSKFSIDDSPTDERVAETTSERRILLVDCDAFFVQVARLVDPEGAGKARLLIVGGSPTGRGVVTSASYEARTYGVRSAMPTAQALRLCPDALVVGVPRGVVAEKSREVRRVLQDLAPVVQAASIDEFYLDLSGTERLFEGEALEASAHRIREEVLGRTRISVSIGGGTRRVIAKLATSKAKPAGVYVVPPGGEQDFLETLDLADLPGVGPSLVEALRQRGLVRVRDAVAVQREWLERWLGKRRGAWLYRRVRGLDDSEVDPHERRRSISSERTFFRDLDRDEELERRLLEISGSVASTLRDNGLRARTVTVKLRDHDFRTRTRSRTLPEPVESDAAIHGAARQLLRELREGRRAPARLLGVGLSGLSDQEEAHQLGLFSAPVAGETERDRSVSRVVDELRTRFGREAVRPGRMLEDVDE